MADLFQNATDAAQFCTNCGKEIQQGTKFCAFCGTQIISTVVVNKESSALAEPLTDSVPEHKSSFFGWGKARKPVLFFVWVFVLALAAEQLYYVWADSKPSMEHGPAMAFWAGILAAMYAPKRRFFGVLWFFIGLVGSVLALGLLSGFVRIFR